MIIIKDIMFATISIGRKATDRTRSTCRFYQKMDDAKQKCNMRMGGENRCKTRLIQS